ncbi:hypothetical protein LQZ19_09360 [Treponema primitia]|uniref:hypothetical protein n=1 Tax=Treponema primitia TaxID=88058 RepID=UPI0039800AEF
MRVKVSLLGNDLEVYGYPHVAQDSETHSCAESALWSLTEYFGTKYTQYKPLLPSQIVKNLLDGTDHRLLPSIGLTKHELAKCLQDNGYQCLMYTTITADFSLLKLYIESGIPLLLVLGNGSDGHALLAIGHEKKVAYTVPPGETWVDVSSLDKKIILIDDNFPPYQAVDILKPTAHYAREELHNLTIQSFIVPLPTHVFLAGEKAHALLENVLDNPAVGLVRWGGKWITRLLLTGSQSFKKFILEQCGLDIGLKQYLLFLSLPKFIWIAEIYREGEIQQGFSSGLLIIDATGDSKSLTAILWYTIDSNMMTHNGTTWDNEIKSVKPFKMQTYQNNLKGAWSKWKN